MKQVFFIFCIIVCAIRQSSAQRNAMVRTYFKTMTTYPFSDPDPIPAAGKIYPYFRFDGYTNTPVQKEWKVVELENDYLKIMILPEVGGKIWAAIEKSTGKSFIYYNHVVKFRDVAMRGPWTSGGIEANYGIIGHTPNCATPVDYTMMEKADGSVSCVIGVLDLLTRTSWRIDINLEKDKAYFTTSSFWYNASSFEQPYYTWMNTGIKAAGNLQFIYPGTHYLGHEGEYADWPNNKKEGKDISFYNNNNFGGYKSYHVFGKYTDFFGGFWHDENFGMGRYSTHDDKAGKKIWIWGLSDQGMIWKDLLSDTDGQYVEVQSGRLFNQSAEGSSFTPFKHRGFMPGATDTWTEYWFPVLNTRGFVAANNYGALNIVNENGWCKIYFSPLQPINDELLITAGTKEIYRKRLRLNPLQLFADSIQWNPGQDLLATIGNKKLVYQSDTAANVLSRPLEMPAGFNWNNAYGLYLKGKENIRERDYEKALPQLLSSLQKEPYFIPALVDVSMILYRSMRYKEALHYTRTALAVDTYDPAANYYYGLINQELGNFTDARDGFDLAAQDISYRSAAYSALGTLYFLEEDFIKAGDYARKCIDFNRLAVDAWQLLAVINKLNKNISAYMQCLDTLLQQDPLNHFARFEKYLSNSNAETRQAFLSAIQNEMPRETFLELASWYMKRKLTDEAVKVLQFAPSNAETLYWLAYLQHKPLEIQQLKAEKVFPFRPETAEIITALMKDSAHWILNYHLALIQWHLNNTEAAKTLFESCGTVPDIAAFYGSRAKFYAQFDSTNMLKDLRAAMTLDKKEWRYARELITGYLSGNRYEQALEVAKASHLKFPENYIVGMLYIKTLLRNEQFEEANNQMKKIRILPNEGATDGRQLYRETQLMLALNAFQKKNYPRSLTYIDAARQWPKNLGVGKPYAADIDVRMENWLAYENFSKQGNTKAAKQLLDSILFYHAQSPSINDLVTAWALKQRDRSEEGLAMLKAWIEKQPSNPTAKWAMKVYQEERLAMMEIPATDENISVLRKYLEVK